MDESIDQDARISIYNSLGQLVTQEIDVQGDRLEISSLVSGQYVLEIVTKAQSYTYQFVKVDP